MGEGTHERFLPRTFCVYILLHLHCRLNTPTVISAFPDYPFPEDCPSFLHHADLLEYLKRYAEQFDLENSITYKTHVERVTPVPVDGKECSEQGLDNVLWEIQYKNLVSGEQKTDMFDAVLICSGWGRAHDNDITQHYIAEIHNTFYYTEMVLQNTTSISFYIAYLVHACTCMVIWEFFLYELNILVIIKSPKIDYLNTISQWKSLQLNWDTSNIKLTSTSLSWSISKMKNSHITGSNSVVLKSM